MVKDGILYINVERVDDTIYKIPLQGDIYFLKVRHPSAFNNTKTYKLKFDYNLFSQHNGISIYCGNVYYHINPAGSHTLFELGVRYSYEYLAFGTRLSFVEGCRHDYCNFVDSISISSVLFGVRSVVLKLK